MDNREKILDVSLNLFYEKGYDAVSVQEIVEAAGITKPTLYYYFGSKYGLLEEILSIGFRNLNSKLDPQIHSNDGDIHNRLFNVARQFFDFAVIDSKFFYFMLSLMYSARGNEPYQAVRPHLIALYQTMIRLFEEAGSQLGNMNGRQEQFAIGFLGIMNQYAFSFSEKHYREDKNLNEHISDTEIYSLIQQFMYGIVN